MTAPVVRDRDLSLDVAKGVAMVLVVIGHVERGIQAADLAPATEGWLALDRGLYLCHLTVFAYLSGLFVRRAVEREGGRAYAVRRSALFVWLFLLWTVIQGGVKAGTGTLANEPSTLSAVVQVWRPEGQLWFFPWLVAATVLVALVQPWRSRRRLLGSLALAGVAGLAAWGFDPPWVFSKGTALYLPFLLGAGIGAEGHRRWVTRGRGVASVLVLVVAVGGWVALAITSATPPTTLGGEDRTVLSVTLGVLGCVLGTVAVLRSSVALARVPVACRVLALIGAASLEILLAHVIVAAGLRVALVQASVEDPVVHLVAGTVAGVVVPLVLRVVVRRLRWAWVFGLPGPVRRAL